MQGYHVASKKTNLFSLIFNLMTPHRMEHPSRDNVTAFPPLPADAIILTGATASGKSAVAMRLAEQFGCEIISLDSIAVYQGMDIGTAKPSQADRSRIPHHLIDVVPPSQEFSVANYVATAYHALDEIRSGGKRPLFVGGTPLYLKAMLHGFDPGPPADWQFRKAVEEDLRIHGAEALHRRLRQVDPLSAHRLPASDTRRVTRALEVAYITGVPLSHRQTHFENSTIVSKAKLYALAWPRELLHQRIQQRVNAMFELGLVKEVDGLLKQYASLSRTAAAAVGYREVIQHLQDALPLASAIEQVFFHTRQLARRQEIWLRSLPSLKALPVESESDLEHATSTIAQALSLA